MSLRPRSWIEDVPAWRLLGSHRFAVQTLIDTAAWMIGIVVATWMRIDFGLEGVEWAEVLLLVVPMAVVAQLAFGATQGLYLGRYRFGSFDEMAAVARSAGLTAVVVAVVNLFVLGRSIPFSASLFSAFIAMVIMAGARYVWRLALERASRPGDDADPVIVFGAGEGGVQVVTSMLRNPASPYRPVALLDDNPGKQNLTINGIAVEGTRADLGGVAARHGADAVVCAIPSASAGLLGELSEQVTQAGLRLLVVPPVRELPSGDVAVGDVRPVDLADLLGRHEVDTDIASIAGYVSGRRVLVTGAGGSIGSELCRQLYNLAPAELMMLDRDESALHGVQLALEGRALLDSPDLIVADIRDAECIDHHFRERRPEVVFHAAALKHLTLLEAHPGEAVKTNVWGTQNVLRAAARHGVDRFVNVSTDKAADPTSVLGYTKALAERLTARTAGETEDATYISVRFGNVLGSRGSVITAFAAQIEAGGPVTVTDPEVTRYFMTIEEAVQLVVQAGAIGHDGEALVLDMGEPVRIDDLARQLVSQADRDVEIVYTGLRPGEKLHEVLVGSQERLRSGPHPSIRHVTVEPLDDELTRTVEAVASVGDAEAIVTTLRRLASV